MGEFTIDGILLPAGLNSAKPGAGTVAKGTLYPATDTGIIYQSDGVSTWTAWGAYTPGGGGFIEYCSVYGDAVSQTNGAETAVACAHHNYDPTSMHSDSVNNSRITIADTGYYHVDAILSFATNATAMRGLELRVNGTTVNAQFVQASTSSGFDTRPIVSCDLYLTSGQYVEVYAYQNSGGALNATVISFNVHRFA